MSILRIITTLIGSALILTLRCSSDVAQGNGENIGTGMVMGMLYEPDGTTPAKGAAVVVRYKNATPLFNPAGMAKTTSALYTTLTDANGVFSFDTIAGGLYVIEGSDDRGNMVFFDSIKINAPSDPITLPPDTLEPSGAISGTITLPDSGNYLQIFVLAFGVDRFSQARPDGSFTFAGLARGVYTLKILSLDAIYLPVDTAGVVVKSNDTTDIGTIELTKRIQQPVPTGLRIAYDTMQMIATFSWHPTPQGVTRGYNIYRDPLYGKNYNGNISTDPRLNKTQLITDTIYTDSAIAYTYHSSSEAITYHVTMVDTSGNESRRSNVITVSPVNAWELYDSLLLKLPTTISSIDYYGISGNDEILLRTHGAGVTHYRYSKRGELMSTWQLPDSLDFRYDQSNNTLINGNYTEGAWLFINFSGFTTTNWRSMYDSVYLFHLEPSGAIGNPLHIEKPSNDEPFLSPGIIVDGSYYFKAPENSIVRIDLATMQKSTFKDYTSEGKRILDIIPGEKGDLAITVNASGKLESIHLTTDGTELYKIDIPFNESFCKAVDDSTFYYEWYFYRRNTMGGYSRCAMPLHYRLLFVRSDGTAIVAGDSDENNTDVLKILCYRLKK